MPLLSLDADVQTDVAARIVAAADELFENSGRTATPNVDTVRRKAHVNMNDASRVMRAWRLAQRSAAAPVPNAIPERVREATQSLLLTVWTTATELANSSLQAAQASWENERVEAEGIRAQLAAAFDAQSAELQVAQASNQDAVAELCAYQQIAINDAAALRKLQAQFDASDAQVTAFRQRCEDLQLHMADMRAALEHSHAEVGHLRTEHARQADEAAKEITHLQTELSKSAESAACAKEENSRLREQLSLVPKKARSRKRALSPRSQPGADAERPQADASKGRKPNGNADTPPRMSSRSAGSAAIPYQSCERDARQLNLLARRVPIEILHEDFFVR